LLNKLKAYKLQSEGMDTLEANEALGFSGDDRDYTVAAQILKDLGITSVRLLTNNPDKLKTLGEHEIDVVERIPHYTTISRENQKRRKNKWVKYMKDILWEQT